MSVSYGCKDCDASTGMRCWRHSSQTVQAVWGVFPVSGSPERYVNARGEVVRPADQMGISPRVTKDRKTTRTGPRLAGGTMSKLTPEQLAEWRAGRFVVAKQGSQIIYRLLAHIDALQAENEALIHQHSVLRAEAAHWGEEAERSSKQLREAEQRIAALEKVRDAAKTVIDCRRGRYSHLMESKLDALRDALAEQAGRAEG